MSGKIDRPPHAEWLYRTLTEAAGHKDRYKLGKEVFGLRDHGPRQLARWFNGDKIGQSHLTHATNYCFKNSDTNLSHSEFTREFFNTYQFLMRLHKGETTLDAAIPNEARVFLVSIGVLKTEDSRNGNSESAHRQPLNERKTAPTAYFPNPFLLPDNYQYERTEFNDVKSLLTDENQRLVAIYGAGGYGKSSLARELCNDCDVRDQFRGGIYWLEFGMRESDALKGREKYRSLSEAIERMLVGQYTNSNRPAISLENTNQDIVALFEKLPDEPILVVADDIWHASQSSWFSDLPDHVSLVATTRIKTIAKTTASEVEIHKLTPAASYTLLTHGMEALAPDQERKLRAIAPKFNGWPLALNLANGVFKSRDTDTGASIDRAIKCYEEFLNGNDILGWDTPQPDTTHNEKRQLFIGYCIQAGLQALDEESRPDLLFDLGVLPDDIDIPISVVVDYWKQHPSHPISVSKARTLIDLFRSYSFLSSMDDEKDTVRLHDEILAYLRQSCGEDIRAKHARLVASIKSHCTDGWHTLPADHQYGWNNLLYHLEAQGLQGEADDLRTDFNWFKAKLEATDILSLQRDFRSPIMSEDATAVGRAIDMSRAVLNEDPKGLALQLYGRLGHELHGSLVELIKAARSDEACWPAPVFPHLASPLHKLLVLRARLETL